MDVTSCVTKSDFIKPEVMSSNQTWTGNTPKVYHVLTVPNLTSSKIGTEIKNVKEGNKEVAEVQCSEFIHLQYS